MTARRDLFDRRAIVGASGSTLIASWVQTRLREISGTEREAVDGDALALSAAAHAIAAQDSSQQVATDSAMVSGVDTSRRASVATAKAQPVAPSVQTIITDAFSPTYVDLNTLAGGAKYVRASYADISALPAAAYWRHDTDRHLPNGSTDATNGGYFVLAEPVVSPTMLGAVGDNLKNDTAAVFAALKLQRPVDLQGRTYSVTGLDVAVTSLRMKNGGLRLTNSAGTRLFWSSTLIEDLDLEDVLFDGNWQGQAGHFDRTVGFEAIKRGSISCCRFINGSGSVLGIWSILENLSIDRCHFSGGKLHTGVFQEDTSYIGLRVATAFQTEEPQYVSITRNTLIAPAPLVPGRGVGGLIAASNTSTGPAEGHKLTVDGNVFYRCGTDAAGNKVAAISLYRRGSFSQITNNKIFFGDEKGIDIQGSDHVTTSGNLIYKTKGAAIAYATRNDNGVSKDCANAIISKNTLVGDMTTSAAPAIDARGIPNGTTAKNLNVSDNTITGYQQHLLITDYLGAVKVHDNTMAGAWTTGSSADKRAVSILGAANTASALRDFRLSFTNNDVADGKNSVYIRGSSRPMRIAGNTWDTISKEVTNVIDGVPVVTSTPALVVMFTSGVLSIQNNSWQNTGAFFYGEQNNGVVKWSNNAGLGSNGVIRPIAFKNSAADISMSDDIYKDTPAAQLFDFDGCVGRIRLTDMMGPPGTTIRAVNGSVASQVDNAFA